MKLTFQECIKTYSRKSKFQLGIRTMRAMQHCWDARQSEIDALEKEHEELLLWQEKDGIRIIAANLEIKELRQRITELTEALEGFVLAKESQLQDILHPVTEEYRRNWQAPLKRAHALLAPPVPAAREMHEK